MLISADWVLPVSRPPIRNGAVLVDGDRVVEVGRREDLEGVQAHERRDFPGCVLMPGLVNAHTHLSLSALEGLLEPDAFERWLPRVVAGMQAWSADDFAASAALGARKCIEAGVTVVGDIAYGPESLDAATSAGLGGTFYWEVLGVPGSRLFAELERMRMPSGTCNQRVRCGLSPHATYSSAPSLLAAVHETAAESSLPMAIHLAESSAESQLFADGTGPLASTARRLIGDFSAPGSTPVAYLDRLGVLDGVTAVHLGEATPGDMPRLAAAVRGAVACPRSNRFLSNRVAPTIRLLSVGVPVGIGTDSSASNEDLDLLSEVRALQAEDPALPARTLIEAATSMGAIVLGLEDRFGILEPGMQADLAVFELGSTDSPEEDLVRRGGRDTVAAVMAGGSWRVLDARAVGEPDEAVAAASAAATERARAAIVATRAG